MTIGSIVCLCNGPHRAFECPKRGKLAALVCEEDRQEEERRVASLRLLNAIHAKVEKRPRGRMFVETEIAGKVLPAMVDTGADTIYMAKELAEEIGLQYTKEKGFIKGVNAKRLPIVGIARETSIRIGEWQGKADITIAPIDDRKFYLGIDFIDEVNALLLPYANTMCIMEEGKPKLIPIKREFGEKSLLSAIQLSKGLKKKEPTFLVAVKTEDEPMGVVVPKPVQEVLEDFKDIMPPELPKTLPPRREVDHAIELEPGAKPPCPLSYGASGA